MTWDAYAAVAEESGQETRVRERELFNRGIERLERINDAAFQYAELVDALVYIRRLWTVFIEDLAQPDNALPEQLRAHIISIGLWVIREADLIQEKRSGDVTQLIEINRLMRDALT